jgi:hypothetical protein
LLIVRRLVRVFHWQKAGMLMCFGHGDLFELSKAYAVCLLVIFACKERMGK